MYSLFHVIVLLTPHIGRISIPKAVLGRHLHPAPRLDVPVAPARPPLLRHGAGVLATNELDAQALGATEV